MQTDKWHISVRALKYPNGVQNPTNEHSFDAHLVNTKVWVWFLISHNCIAASLVSHNPIAALATLSSLAGALQPQSLRVLEPV